MMKKEHWYILAGVGLFIAGYFVGKSRKSLSSDFAGVSKEDYLKNPYAKASDSSGYSQVFRLSEFFHNPTRKVIDFTQIEILDTRVLNGQKFYGIGKDEYMLEEDIIIPKTK